MNLSFRLDRRGRFSFCSSFQFFERLSFFLFFFERPRVAPGPTIARAPEWPSRKIPEKLAWLKRTEKETGHHNVPLWPVGVLCSRGAATLVAASLEPRERRKIEAVNANIARHGEGESGKPTTTKKRNRRLQVGRDAEPLGSTEPAYRTTTRATMTKYFRMILQNAVFSGFLLTWSGA